MDIPQAVSQAVKGVNKDGKKRKTPERISAERCMHWLNLAYYETLRFGFCQPMKWEEQAGQKILPTNARELGYLVNGIVRGKPMWFDMSTPPTGEMSVALSEEYVRYRLEKGKRQTLQRKVEMEARQAHKKQEAEAVKAAKTVVIADNEPSVVDMFNPPVADTDPVLASILAQNEHFQKHLDVLTNEVAKTNLLLIDFMNDVGCSDHYDHGPINPADEEETPF